MPHKDPAAAARYWAAYYADPANQKKNRAKVKAWRKAEPEAFRAQSRRARKAARSREALREVEAIRQAKELKAKIAAALGYDGEIKPGHF